MAAGNLDLAVLALLGIFATAGFVGSFLSLLKTARPPAVADVPLILLIPATGSGVDRARLAGVHFGPVVNAAALYAGPRR